MATSLGALVATGAVVPGQASAVVQPKPPLITTLGNPGCAPGAASCGLALLYPSGGATGPDGTLYTADTAGSQIEAWDSTGNQIWRVGQSAANKKSLGQFLQPRDLAYVNSPGFRGLDDKGLIYVADLANNRVDVLNAEDGSLSSLGTGWTTRFNSIIGISSGVDAHGNPIILATDSAATPERVFSPDGTLITSVGTKCTKAPGTCGPSELLAPRDAATDAAGNVYVADYTNNRIVEFGANDLTTAIRDFGSTGSGNLQFARPYGVDFDSQGHLYVADSNNNRIQEFDVSAPAPATPTYLATYGSSSAPVGQGKFIDLRRVAVTSGPNPIVYGFDLWGDEVEAFPAVTTYPGTGTMTELIGGSPPAAGAFNSPYGVTVGAGEVFVADTNNQRMQGWNQSTNSYLYSFGQRGFGETNLGYNWPRDISYSSATNTVWVADTKNYRVTEFSLSGDATGRSIGKVGVLNWPFAVTAYGNDVIIADTLNNRVQMWNPNTNAVLWTTDQLGITMKQPRAMTLGADPNNPGQTDLYVADSLDKQILVLNPDTGALLRTIAPNISAGLPALHRVEGLAVDPRNGHIWVSDSSFNRLIELSADGSTVLTYFGNLGTANGQFSYPSHLALDNVNGVETLYVCDYWNNRIQVYNVTAF